MNIQINYNQFLTRENILNAARRKYPKVLLGDSATIAECLDGYWVGVTLYVRKKDVINSCVLTQTNN